MVLHGAGGGGWMSLMRRDASEKPPPLTRELLKRVASYGRPYWKQTALILISILASSLIALVPPLLFRDLLDNALPNKDLNRLFVLALGMIAIPLVDGLNGVGQRWLSSRVGEGVIADLRKALYAHMQQMSLRFFTNTKTGELMSRLNNDVVGAQRAVTSTMITVITSVFQVITILAIMLSLEWRLTVLALLMLPLFILPAQRIATILRELIQKQLDLNGKMNALMAETLNVSGALLVKLFGRQTDEIDKFSRKADEVAAIGVRQTTVGRWFFMLLGLIGAVGTAVVYVGGGYLVLQGTFTVGTIVAFAAYLNSLYSPVAQLSNARVDLATSLVSFERVFAVLDLPVEISEASDALVLDRARGDITFDRVSFSYLEEEKGGAEESSPEIDMPSGGKSSNGNGRNGHDGQALESIQARRWALRQVSFKVISGQLVALVGPSGAGKTTITYLIPRLYDPTEGSISLDGRDLRSLNLASLQKQIGMVTQETFLFHDTIRSNLIYAKPEATEEEITRAARAANIHDFIVKLPQGYETIVGERGYRLSGGEKQRVAIARVILKDPRILILDEATSSLDSESEALIQDALKPLMRDRSTIAIAHRLSTILAADLILVMDEGRIVEQGTHSDLLGQNGLYARLYYTQFRKQESLGV